MKESAGRYIAAIHRQSQIKINEKLKEHDIRSGQHDFFFLIANHQGITQKEVSEILCIGKATTAKAVKNLEKQGYIKRIVCQEDKRFYKLFLTEKGEGIKPVIDATFNEMIVTFLAGFSEDEAAIAMKVLERMLNNVMS